MCENTQSRPRPVLALALLLGGLGCGDSGAGGEVWTDGGTWRVTVEDPVQSTGWGDVGLSVADESGDPAPGLTLTCSASMPAMGHDTGEDVTVQDDTGGAYTVHLYLSMAGTWLLACDVSDGTLTETFSTEIEAE